MKGEVIKEFSISWNFDIRDDALLSTQDICEELDITKTRFKKLRMGNKYSGGLDPICFFKNGLSPYWSAKMLRLWMSSHS